MCVCIWRQSSGMSTTFIEVAYETLYLVHLWVKVVFYPNHTTAWVFKVWYKNPWETPRTFSEVFEVIIILRCHLPFLLSFSCENTGQFCRDHMMYDVVPLGVQKTNKRIQLSSIKLGVKGIYKNVKQQHSSHCLFQICYLC